MPGTDTYKIRKVLLIPLAVALFSLAVMLLLSFYYTPFPGERFMLTLLFVIFSAVLFNFLLREVSLDDRGIRIKAFYKRRYMAWEEVTGAGTLVMGPKAYLLLTTVKGYHIITNNYEEFHKILNGVRMRLDEVKVEREISRLIDNPLQNYRPVVLAWLTAVATLFLTALRIFYKL